MLTRSTKKLLLFIVPLLIAACRPSFQIQTETFNEHDITTYDSFKFFNPQRLPKANFSFSEENKKVIFDAVAEELKNFGYTSHQKAALLIKVQGGTIAEREVKQRYPTGYPYYGPGYMPYPTYDNYYVDISRKKTTIIVDVLNAETNKLLWQGVATGEMGRRPEEVEAKLKEAIELIFKEFPASPAAKE